MTSNHMRKSINNCILLLKAANMIVHFRRKGKYIDSVGLPIAVLYITVQLIAVEERFNSWTSIV